MDSCSTELAAFIFEFACADDFGQTARRLGLVSKRFRAIAEPIELREIEISGLEQLEGALKRLERMDRPGELSIVVRHLFISELKREHALAAEEYFSYDINFWDDKEGERPKGIYDSHSTAFWAAASTIVAKTSPTLRTLFLLASNHWLLNPFPGNVHPTKVLGVLAGTTFPCLTSLAVGHDLGFDIMAFEHDHIESLAPAVPALRKLLIISQLWRPFDSQKRFHPLLYGLLKPMSPELTDVGVCCAGLEDAENLMQLVFGENWRAEPLRRNLPGKMRSLKLQQEPRVIYNWADPNEHAAVQAEAQDFVLSVERLHIDGLVAHSPIPRFSELGYDQLLIEWKEQCLESPLL